MFNPDMQITPFKRLINAFGLDKRLRFEQTYNGINSISVNRIIVKFTPINTESFQNVMAA